MNKVAKSSVFSLTFNITYSAYYIVSGIIMRSWWLLTVGGYYLILSIVRSAVLSVKSEKRSVACFTGIMLMVLSLPLVGTVILAFFKDRGTVFHEIIMITIAVYAFTKITLAAVKWVRSQKKVSERVITLRYISFADAFVSIFSLQRSMLVSFGDMSESSIRMMNAATGSAVCVIVFCLGLKLFLKGKAWLKGL